MKKKDTEVILKYISADKKQAHCSWNGEEITLPRFLIPKNIVENESFVLIIRTLLDHQSKKNQTAKDILNEILNHN